MCVDWRVAVATYICGLVIVIIKKYISLCSLVMVIVAPIYMLIFNVVFKEKINVEAIIIMFVIGFLAYYQHIPNIKRLIKGEENKFTVKKNK